MQDTQKTRLTALSGTLAFHGALLLILLLFIIKTPIPPYPDSGTPGLEVNLGFSDDGMGDVQPDNVGVKESNPMEIPVAEPRSVPVKTAFKPPAQVLTQETEDAPTVDKPVETKNPAQPTDVAGKEPETPKEQKRVANPSALYKGKSSSKEGGNEGETGKPGDQGVPEGSKTAKYHGPGGSSGDTQGTGPGGSGQGPGTGGGVSFSLANRKPSSLAVPKSDVQEEGRVVVEITVDQNGNVISAKPGVKGSTTANSKLLEIARRAALNAKFNASPDSPEEQKGTITYNFILR